MITRYKCRVSYDGTQYDGFQTQPNKNTIQDRIEYALSTIEKEPVRITGSGRTDAKVHALGQVFHFDSSLAMEPMNWLRAINSLLPPDIYVQSVERADSSFHARYQVQTKEYHYLINQGEYNPLQVHYSYQLGKHLSVDSMRQAAGLFVGTHDFRNFCSNEEEKMVSFERILHSLTIIEEGDQLRFIFIGNGFLRYMVRMIVGTLIEIGRKRIDERIIRERLDVTIRNTISFKAPASGLYLVQVNYHGREEICDDFE